MIKEDEETFKISIIDYSLPFGVMSGGPAIITINDNDSEFSEIIAYCKINCSRWKSFTATELKICVWLFLNNCLALRKSSTHTHPIL